MIQHSPAERFKRSVLISKTFMPRHRQRARLPRRQWPKAIAREYMQQITAYLEAARALVEREIVPMLPGLAAAGRHDAADHGARLDAADHGARLDAGQSEFNKKMDELSKTFFDKLPTAEIERLAEEFARRTSSFEKAEATKEMRAAFGVDVMAAEPNLAGRVENFVAENVALIKSIPSQYFDDIEKHVMRAVREAQSPEQLSKVISERYGVAEDRATLIARDQLGKFYGEVAGARQQAIGVTHYIWRTSNDERVREEHNAREGQRFAWDDPPEDGAPGEAINCRCFAEPDLTPLLAGDEPLDQSEPVEEPAPERAPQPPPEPSPEDRAREQAREAERAQAAAEADAARAREAHQEELTKRLAEQELSREAVRQANLEQARALAEAEAARKAAEDAERRRAEHEAEMARRLAEQEAAREAARLAAEAEAVRLRAEAEAARVRAEQEAQARAAAEAESRRLAEAEAARVAAEQASKPPLRDEHLAAAKGKEGIKLARDRERHLDAMRSEPVDVHALAEDLKDAGVGGLSERAQVALREHLNRIVAQEGARIMAADLRNPEGDRLRPTKPGELSANAGAVHTWEGEIIVADPRTLGHAKDFAVNVAANPHHYREESARITTERDALNDNWTKVNKEHKDLNARRNELVGKKRLSKAEKAEKAELDLKFDDVLARAEVLRAFDQNLRDSKSKMDSEIHSMQALLHENMHGHSPMTGHAYNKVGVPVEEIATELSARVAMAKQFNVPDTQKADHWKGTYEWFIDPAVEQSAAAAKIALGGVEVSAAEAYAKLQEASIAMKQDHTVISTSPEKHFEIFANKLADAYGLEKGRKRDGFFTRLEIAFNDIQHRTP